MKLNGNLIEARYTKKISFKRDPEPIVFTLQSFQDDGTLDEILPRPKPKVLTVSGGEKIEDTESQGYQDEIQEWGEKQIHYMAIKTIQDVEWDSVKMDDPSTWKNWSEDMTSAGFSTSEVLKMQTKIFEVNGMSEDAVMDAEKN